MDWADLIEDVRIELGLLRQLLDEARDLVGAVKAGRSSATDSLAAGSVLQSFYNGVEKVFILIATHIDHGWAKGDNARRSLLEAVSQPAEHRPAVVDENLSGQLRRYMEFREAFRYAHFFRLTWESTAPLVIDLPRTMELFEEQVEEFLQVASGRQVDLSSHGRETSRYWTKEREVAQPKLSLRPVLAACFACGVLGLLIGAAAAWQRMKPPAGIPATVFAPFLENPQLTEFVEPSGRTHRLPISEANRPFAVTDGKLIEYTEEGKFTGRVARKPEAPDALPILALWFQEGRPLFFQALPESGGYERGTFAGDRLLRYDVCGRDGMPRRTFHLARDGRTSCEIERMRPDGATVEGWVYRFYDRGTLVGEWFVADDGRARTLNESPDARR